LTSIRKRFTYANVMSSIAVFLVLGGATAFAAQKIGSNQLKANSITTGKIKKEAVTTAKIKKNAVTGAKVNVSTLGTVPSAAHATNADNATNFSRYFTSGVVKASGGQTVQLLAIGPFKVIGHCDDVGGGEFESWTELTTSQSGSTMSAYENYYYNADFDPGDEAELGYSVRSSEAESSEESEPYRYNGWEATSADGKTLLSGVAFSSVNMFGSPCAFWVSGTSNG
jgi:hypothetical protein